MEWRDVEPRDGFDLRLGVVSQDVDNSMLIAVLKAAFGDVGLNAEIVQIEPDVAEFDEAVLHLKACGFRGAAVGNPHKVLAARVGEKFFLARESIGVANCLLFETAIYARNTEVAGFIQTISHLEPARALVMGTGQAARSVVMGLFQAGWQIRSWNRNAMKSRVLQTTFKRYGDIELINTPDPSGCKLVVNATPVGLKLGEKVPLEWSHVQPKTVMYDLVVRRVPTEMLREATLRGLKTIGGRELLVEQAALAVEWWTGKSPSKEEMRTAANLR